MRKKILDLLYQQQGDYVSGEEISQRFHITRAAVWKQIKVIKDHGYEIEAQTKKGYRLLSMPLDLDEWAIQQELRTVSLGRALKVFDELPSTNDYAKDWILQGAEHGAVILAKKQSSGRGRLRRVWESPQGGLWMSIILKPNLELAEAARLTLSAGVALAQTCENLYGLEVKIKWPNDIVVKGQKLAGILGEVVGEWNTVQSMILGIGINANLNHEMLSPEFPASTLKEQLGQRVNLNRLVAEVLFEMERELLSLESKDTKGLIVRWLNYATGIGSSVVIERANQQWQGIYKGITASGELILEHNGQDIHFSSGDVKLRAPNQYSP